MKKMGRMQLIAVLFVQVIVIGISLLFGYFIGIKYGYAQFDFPVLSESASLLTEYGLFSPIDNQQMEYGMIRGMLQAYNDPFSNFFEPAQHELQTDQLTGLYGGIGSGIQIDSSGNYYLLPYPDSPAEKSQVVENSRLLAIDNSPILNFTSMDDIAAAIRGKVGSKVMLELSMPPEYTETYTVNIKREEFSLPSVQSFIAQADPSVGVIQISIIAESSPEEVSNAILELTDRGAESFIIDLRNNGGGLLDSGIDLAELFLPKGQIILRNEEKDQDPELVFSESDGAFVDLPIILLVIENTASAAEIFAGSLQANQRCSLIGKQTYGKNTIQLVFELQDSSSIHITNAQWGFPELPNFTTHQGLVPDYSFQELDSFDPIILETAIDIITNY